MNIEDYIKYGTVIQCETENDCVELMELLDELGYSWSGGTRYTTHSNWNYYKDQTCYNVVESSYCDVHFYTEIYGWKVVKFSDIQLTKKSKHFLNKNLIKRELKL